MSVLGLIIDAVILVLFLIFGFIGYKKGLLKSVISLFNWIVCILIAVFIAKYVANWINGIYNFSGLIGGKIAKSLSAMNDFFSKPINLYESVGKDALIKSIPKETNGLLTQLIKIIFTNTNVDMSSSETIASVLGESLGYICMVVISGILVFIVLKIAVALLSKLFDKITQTKVLGGLNKILGLALGVIKATIIVFLFNGVLIALTLVPVVNKTISPLIENHTYVERVVYKATDALAEKYIIESNAIQTWVNGLWEAR